MGQRGTDGRSVQEKAAAGRGLALGGPRPSFYPGREGKGEASEKESARATEGKGRMEAERAAKSRSAAETVRLRSGRPAAVTA